LAQGGETWNNMSLLPPLGLMVAGSFAPMQLSFLAWFSRCSAYISGIQFATSLGVFVADTGKACPDILVWVWLYGTIAFAVLMVVLNAWLAYKAQVAFLMTEADAQASSSGMTKTGNAVWDTFTAVQGDSGFFFRALFAYDKLERSFARAITRVSTVFQMIWGAFGFYITVADVVEDTEKCESKAVLWFMHACAFCFVFFFAIHFFGVLFWLASLLGSSDLVSVPIIRMAKDFDDLNPLKLPICLTIVRSMVLRGSSDILAMQEDDTRREIAELEKQAQEMEAKLLEKRQLEEQLTADRLAAQRNEEELIKLYEDQVRDGLAQMAPFAAIAAISGDHAPQLVPDLQRMAAPGLAAAQEHAQRAAGAATEAVQQQAPGVAAAAATAAHAVGTAAPPTPPQRVAERRRGGQQPAPAAAPQAPPAASPPGGGNSSGGAGDAPAEGSMF